MEYTILVLCNGKHLFETGPHSTPGHLSAMELFNFFKKVFPKEVGYTIKLLQHVTTTSIIEVQ